MYCNKAKRSDIWISKSSPNFGGFNILISKCISHYNAMYFFDISTTKVTRRCGILYIVTLKIKLPTIWTNEKQSRAEAERKEKLEKRRLEKRKNQKKEDADTRKGRKIANYCVFPMICGSGGSKSRLVKAAGTELAGQIKDKNYIPL